MPNYTPEVELPLRRRQVEELRQRVKALEKELAVRARQTSMLGTGRGAELLSRIRVTERERCAVALEEWGSANAHSEITYCTEAAGNIAAVVLRAIR
jgi:hypothetical protein